MSGLITKKPNVVDWPQGHFYFIEAKVSTKDVVKKATEAWNQLQENLKKTDLLLDYKNDEPMMLGMMNDITGKNGFYRAGVLILSKKDTSGSDLQYTEYEGGQYWEFIVKGSHSKVGDAWSKVFDRIDVSKMKDDLSIEYYVNDPETTPEKDLETRIMISKEKE